eukprot:NODE_19017_length_864_cov_3.234735.p1 GENE.NODE_19017_length_864_cov_3.234735~~NODE_19017_length_864_cov_3.234735.p1  ORF type:complete len:120 (-),score=25.62 NODE_19017_length_864_cov_3.234735:505-822(-)
MGGSLALPTSLADSLRAVLQPRRVEPCQEHFDAYMQCCSSHERTRDMIDCEDIVALFQQCMRQSKLGADAAIAPQAELPPGVLPEGQAPSQHVGPRSIKAGLAEL